MLKNIYVVQDKAAKAFHQPVLSDTDATALRAFRAASLNPESFLNKFPDDHDLFRVGTFNVETGEVKPISPIVLVGRARDYVFNGAPEQSEEVAK